MLNIAKIDKKPTLSEYHISELELEKYLAEKKRYEREKKELEEKNEKKAKTITLLTILFISYLIVSIITTKKLSLIATIITIIALSLFLFLLLYWIFYAVIKKVVDFITDKPIYILYFEYEKSAERYESDLKKYNNTIDKITKKYPDIEKVNFKIDEYHKLVINEMSKLLDFSFQKENILWWNNQVLNFKICVIRILQKANYKNIHTTGSLSDAMSASFSYAVDIKAESDGDIVCFRCFRKNSQTLTKNILESFIKESDSKKAKKKIFVTNYIANEISKDILDYAKTNKIDIWDVYKLIELTKGYNLISSEINSSIILPSNFFQCESFVISRNLNDELLTIIPYKYYLLSNELFESYKDALTKAESYPKANIYYGVCEYPRNWQTRGKQQIFTLVACDMKSGMIWRLAKECKYIYDANSRLFITTNHSGKFVFRSEFMPFSL